MIGRPHRGPATSTGTRVPARRRCSGASWTTRIERGDAVVLAGRCYERESVPYKALDSLIDALGRHLKHLPEAEVAALLPRDMASLARVFPGLRQVEARAHAPRRVFESPDPQELRRRAFSALRELLARLGDRTPLVLAIDDLQWGDVDSAALIAELLDRPTPRSSCSSGPIAPRIARPAPSSRRSFSSSLHARRCATRRRRPRASRPARCVARYARVVGRSARPGGDPCAGERPAGRGRSRSRPRGPGRVDRAGVRGQPVSSSPSWSGTSSRTTRSRERAGRSPDPSPFREHGLRNSSLDGTIALDDVLWARIRRLPEEARRVLEIIAVSGQPLELEADQPLRRTSRTMSGCPLALLRSGRLIRSTGRIGTDEIETYHDRIRETVVARLEPEVTREHHRRLALALEASGSADPEVLGVHFLGSGQPERAADYFARAADQAAEALAFDRAAGLYRRGTRAWPGARALRRRTTGSMPGWATPWPTPAAGPRRRPLTWPPCPAHPSLDAIELQRRAAMQLLISGHIDEGLATLRTVLKAIGMALPDTPRRALLSLLLQRARLRLRGLGFRERDSSEIAPAELTRIDVCWSAGAGLSVVDTIRGADFQARGLLLSLRAGEPSRIARALAMEAAHAASTGGTNRQDGPRGCWTGPASWHAASRILMPQAWSRWPAASRPTSKDDGSPRNGNATAPNRSFATAAPASRGSSTPHTPSLSGA